jgi:hypothetical protein
MAPALPPLFQRNAVNASTRSQSQRNVRCRGRTKADQSVLNDRWILFPTTSTSENFVAAQKNVCEQQMFKCEDERYELDMGMVSKEPDRSLLVVFLYLLSIQGTLCVDPVLSLAKPSLWPQPGLT